MSQADGSKCWNTLTGKRSSEPGWGSVSVLFGLLFISDVSASSLQRDVSSVKPGTTCACVVPGSGNVPDLIRRFLLGGCCGLRRVPPISLVGALGGPDGMGLGKVRVQ